MKIVVTTASSTEHAAHLREMFRLRRIIFYERLRYRTTPVPGGERDAYDTEETRYVLCVDASGVLAFARLNPTLSDYMIADVWPEAVSGPVPRDATVVEGSRLAVNPRLRASARRAALDGLRSGMFGDCRRHGV